MAGPGGGPPRKSHTKSRKGCKTCKRRHIRCDETMPQCRNCTKHNCRCDYMDVFIAQEQAASTRCPDLLMSPEIEMEIDTWQRTGNPPFPELQPSSRTYWYRFSKTDLRLIHHISGLSIDLHRRGYSSCTVWAQKMPIFLAIALSSDFVMSAILALSASHLAWMTQNQDTEHLAYHHRGVALKGLHEAIGSFSRGNSDAILAASLLLSWQATEWRSWASLQQGVSTVLNSMETWWKDESELARFMDSQRAFRSARSPLTPTYPGGMAQFHNDDIMRFDRILASLQNIHQRVSHNQEHYRRITDLLSFAHRLREDLPVQSPEKAFERLQPLRTWLFWLPPTMLRGGDTDLGALAVLSQFFGLALALEPIFPEFGGSYLGSMSVTPIEDIRKILYHRRATNPFAPEVPLALSLMELPGEIVAEYRSRLQWSPRASLDAYSSGSHSPYQSLPTPHLPPTPTTASHYPTYTTSPLHSPLSPAIVGSPYQMPTIIDSRRHSQAFTASPSLPPESIDDRTAEYKHHPHEQHPAVFNPAYLGNLIHPGTPLGIDYGHSAPLDVTGGLVAPELCWT
ncbi:Fungal Zn binuclear cluster domain containing protein [Coccidioides posadasii C735 delta SOWgp]|uniref:Fungal Zn binuclear cluster domain containing protein n=1 Tax=Coccidioides posadasii (strain C735) TaxID=222929 RepID=C5P8B3_COCP7|nr:Fungal Zn binuclear cluster domain containing protein [Coccidioides posadasii C735 delta SOWgp]EER26884.1 Fungal Zn binuclear cluster domain containing protein [Coccidioides posadasii C735 delta SOWgp]|eukprot:XP_003069029.1 Fungal Zn binuclear cluster domain containing protein [Coccidioides posadasii C735 delta SOWgp]